LASIGFGEAKSDTSLFIYQRGDDTIDLLLYINDIVLMISTADLLQHTIVALQREFAMKDLGPSTTSSASLPSADPRVSSFTSTSTSSTSTLVHTQAKLCEDDGPPVTDAMSYQSQIGTLQYLTFFRPNITYTVHQLCLHMHIPREPHLTALKRILRYLLGSFDYGLLLQPSPTSDLVVYTDADWAGCPDMRRSTSGYAVFLGTNLVSWVAKRQPVVSRFSAETECRAVANSVAKASWMRQLLHELHSPLHRATLIYCDNINTIYLSTSPCSISAQSMWRLICTSSVSVSLPVLFGFSAS
jgi:hypothetical protein